MSQTPKGLKTIFYTFTFLAAILFLAACDSATTSQAPRGVQLKPAPLTAKGADLFFGHLEEDQSLIKPLIAAFEKNPYETYLEVIELTDEQEKRLGNFEIQDLMVRSIVNVLETTLEVYADLAPKDRPPLKWYYLDCKGEVSTADYNTLFELQGYFLSVVPAPSLSEMAAALNGC